jgi:SpoVK/Ycf46/Vps4 family AAA+-type ATPase
VALRNDSYTLHKILPTKVDPLVSLMKVEKVPDATYDMVGGLDKQILEIKEVIELPIKHPELFEALGVAQPKVRAGAGRRCERAAVVRVGIVDRLQRGDATAPGTAGLQRIQMSVLCA